MNISIKDFIELKEKLNQIGVEIIHKRYDENLVFIEVRNIYKDIIENRGSTLSTWQIIDEAKNELEKIRRKEI